MVGGGLFFSDLTDEIACPAYRIHREKGYIGIALYLVATIQSFSLSYTSDRGYSILQVVQVYNFNDSDETDVGLTPIVFHSFFVTAGQR